MPPLSVSSSIVPWPAPIVPRSSVEELDVTRSSRLETRMAPLVTRAEKVADAID